MIKINLLTAERKVAKKKGAGAALGAPNQMAVACGFILLLGLGFVGWRYWAIQHDNAKLDADIANAQKETQRLHSVIVQVQQFEQRKAQLQQRVSLIEQLRSEQTGPVHMLDQISRALPPMVWLSEVKQTPASTEVLIEGRATTITSVSDFVGALEKSGYFKKSVEIVSSTTQQIPQPPGEVVNFTLKAIFLTPGAPKPPAAEGAPAAAAASPTN